MNRSSSSTVISSRRIGANDGNISHTSKTTSSNNMVARNTSPAVSSGTKGTITTSSLTACAGSSASTSASYPCPMNGRKLNRLQKWQVFFTDSVYNGFYRIPFARHQEEPFMTEVRGKGIENEDNKNEAFIFKLFCSFYFA